MPAPSELNRTTYGAVVGRILANRREYLGLEQMDIAKKLGISQPSWSRIERGETALTLEALARVAMALGMTSTQILDEAESAKTGLDEMGIEVLLERPRKGEDMAIAILGGAMLAFLIAKVFSKG